MKRAPGWWRPAAVLLLLAHAACAAGGAVPRRILALYESDALRAFSGPEVYAGNVQRLAEMPLNHLGLVVDYRNVREGLPPPRDLDGVRGILLWFDEDLRTDPEVFLSWCEQAMDAGLRVVLIGNLPLGAALQDGRVPARRVNRFWSRLGLRWQDDPVHITYRVETARKDPSMVEFERALPARLPPYEATRVIDPRATSHLALRERGRADSECDLVVTGPGGGYVAENYLAYHSAGGYYVQWYLHPFEFFRRAFATDDLPKPDVTTMCGRRIFYSHIDGDGWRSESEVGAYRERHAHSAEVVCREILEKFPDLPVTVGPVVADVHPEWFGSREDQVWARRIFALPNVEAGSHTWTHPLSWAACAGMTAPDSDGASDRSEADDRLSVFGAGGPAIPAGGKAGGGMRARPKPREPLASYERGPFDLRREIEGSIRYLSDLCPDGKRVELLQWPGDCCPFEAAVAAASAAGVRALNGGDSRFDAEYPSCLWVAPVGRPAGDRRQVFASNSNEETYTDLWTGRFFGFRDLLETVRRTESPVRLRPFNVYYHMYSGEREASLAAVVGNLAEARRQELIPIAASHYAGVADGFFTARLVAAGPRAWRIEDRDRLQTVRFDAGVSGVVDFAESRGAIGQRRHQGSLYVALDPAAPAARVALTEGPADDASPEAPLPYLVESRWPVWDVRASATGLVFRTAGFGEGAMTWKLPGWRSVTIRGAGSERTVEPTRGLCRFSAGPGGAGTVELVVSPRGAGP